MHLLHVAGAADCACAVDDRHAIATLSSDVAMSDWGDLLTAVKGRLGSIASDAEAQPTLPAQRIQAALLECVTALDQLQLTLANELGRHHDEVCETRTALAQARAELAGTQASETRARHLALHDPLTMLPNRSHLQERLSRIITNATPDGPALAVLFLDLDGFKQVNDAHGHDAGDRLLKIVAARLHRAVRADDMVGRLGGDEFGLLLCGATSRGRLTQLAAKLLATVAAPVRIGRLTISVRASVGIAVCPGDGASADELLRHADAAMYIAKRNQRGHAFYGDPVEAR